MSQVYSLFYHKHLTAHHTHLRVKILHDGGDCIEVVPIHWDGYKERSCGIRRKVDRVTKYKVSSVKRQAKLYTTIREQFLQRKGDYYRATIDAFRMGGVPNGVAVQSDGGNPDSPSGSGGH